MKNIVFILFALLSISFSAFGQVENVAKEVLEAYKTKNVELLKTHASGMMKMAISDSYFKDEGLQQDIAAAENWDGEFREIRYNSDDMMGNMVYLAALHFADVVENENDIYTVVLSSLDKENWVMFGSGIVAESKKEFEKMRLTLLASEENDIAKEKVAVRKVTSFSLEMYDGPGYEKVTQKQVEESFATLSADNFFISLANDDNWLQVAYSDKGYSVDYNDASGHFMLEDYLTKEAALQLLLDYLNQKEGWNKSSIWVDFAY